VTYRFLWRAAGIAFIVLVVTEPARFVTTKTRPSVPFRAFSDASEWNRPLPIDAPIDPNSQAIIEEIKTYPNGGYPRMGGGSWAEPIYWATDTDPEYTIDPSGAGPTLVDVHIPLGAEPADTSDAQMAVFDTAKGTVFNLWRASFDGTTWTASGSSEFDLSSNGIGCALAESDRECPMNSGHRGFPAAIHAVRYDEVQAGAVNHVIKVGLDKTAPCNAYPATGHERRKGGLLTCEGLILRIKPTVDLLARGLRGGPLVIARAMKWYGAVVGETGGTAMSVKLENLAAEGATESWSTLGVTANAFEGKLTFDDFVVVRAGYHRP
jgi:hypothetical protein